MNLGCRWFRPHWLITAQLLKANGCNVIGFDFDQSKVDLANGYGIDAAIQEKGKQVEYVLEKTIRLVAMP